jgi:hypothetical protein
MFFEHGGQALLDLDRLNETIEMPLPSEVAA